MSHISEDIGPETDHQLDTPVRQLSPEARRALDEAETRRADRDRIAADQARPSEIGGQQGPDPVRYGDWEKGGIASDF